MIPTVRTLIMKAEWIVKVGLAVGRGGPRHAGDICNLSEDVQICD